MTGLLPRSPRGQGLLSAVQYAPPPEALRTVIQPVVAVRDQKAKPSCAGQAYAAGIDAVLGGGGGKLVASATDLWTDARRRQGRLEGAHWGTRSEYVIESLIERGWSPYQPGEDDRPVGEDVQMPGLAAELAAHDHRQLNCYHYDVRNDRCTRVVSALARGFVVVLGTGVRRPFIRPTPGATLTSEHLGGPQDGHALRIAGYHDGLGAFLVQNSWGASWNRAENPENGKPAWLGCAWVNPEVIDQAWEINVIEIRK